MYPNTLLFPPTEAEEAAPPQPLSRFAPADPRRLGVQLRPLFSWRDLASMFNVSVSTLVEHMDLPLGSATTARPRGPEADERRIAAIEKILESNKRASIWGQACKHRGRPSGVICGVTAGSAARGSHNRGAVVTCENGCVIALSRHQSRHPNT